MLTYDRHRLKRGVRLELAQEVGSIRVWWLVLLENDVPPWLPYIAQVIPEQLQSITASLGPGRLQRQR